MRCDCHSVNYCNLSNCKLCLKNILDFNVIQAHGLCVNAAVLCHVSYEDLSRHHVHVNRITL